MGASLDSYSIEDTQSDCEFKKQIETDSFQNQMQEMTLKAINREPKLFLGLPSHTYFCLEYLCHHVKIPPIDVLLTVRKIRWYEPNSMLAIYFGTSESTVARRFKFTLPKVAQCMQELVFIPSRADIHLNLPIRFRKRYSKVVSIIDCFEIQIEKAKCSCNSSPHLVSVHWQHNKILSIDHT